MKPLASAIIPTYNRAVLLVRALDSVIAQTYRPVEVVVIDDGSTDNTDEVMEAYRKKLGDAGIALIYHKQSNGKAPLARNNGMKLATGELFAFLDSDDLWKPRMVEVLAELLVKHPSAGLSFCGILVVDENDVVWKSRFMNLPKDSPEGVLERPFEFIMDYMPLQTSGVIVRRSVVEELGDFDLELPVVEDWDLWYRVSKRYDFAYTQAGLACNRLHADNLPKLDKTALTSSLKMNLKHFEDIEDEKTRNVMLARLKRQFTLLQEELLREGKGWNGSAVLLSNPLAPRSARYVLGSVVARAPSWLGRPYGRLVRTLGTLRRGA